jgi:hypothetical protein
MQRVSCNFFFCVHFSSLGLRLEHKLIDAYVCVSVCVCVYLGRVPRLPADVATGALCERARWGQLVVHIGFMVSIFEFGVLG